MTTPSRIAIAIVALWVSAPAAAQSSSSEPSVRELLTIINERSAAISQQFAAQEKAVAAALAATQKETAFALSVAKEATSKSEVAYDKRFEGVNEFRGTLRDQQQTLLPRVEADIRFQSVQARLSVLETANSQAAGRAEGVNWLSGFLIALGGAVGGVLLGGVAVAGFFRQRLKGT